MSAYATFRWRKQTSGMYTHVLTWKGLELAGVREAFGAWRYDVFVSDVQVATVFKTRTDAKRECSMVLRRKGFRIA